MNTTVLAVTLFQKNFRKQNIRPFVIGYHSLMVETDRSIRIHLSVAHRHFNLKTSLQPFQIKKKRVCNHSRLREDDERSGPHCRFGEMDGCRGRHILPTQCRQLTGYYSHNTAEWMSTQIIGSSVQTVEMFGVDEDHLALPLPLHSPSRRCRPSL